jgi:hypothetical protein
LSNFWEKDVIIEDNIDKRTYESGEHCFHGEKYIRLGRLSTDKQRKKELIFYGLHFKKPSKYKTCAEAKKMGGKNGLVLTSEELEMWHILSSEVQIKISMYKYETYDEVKEDIRQEETAETFMMHHAPWAIMEQHGVSAAAPSSTPTRSSVQFEHVLPHAVEARFVGSDQKEVSVYAAQLSSGTVAVSLACNAQESFTRIKQHRRSLESELEAVGVNVASLTVKQEQH